MALTQHAELNEWVDEMAHMCRPDEIVLKVPSQFPLFLGRERELDLRAGGQARLIRSIQGKLNCVLPAVLRPLLDAKCDVWHGCSVQKVQRSMSAMVEWAHWASTPG